MKLLLIIVALLVVLAFVPYIVYKDSTSSIRVDYDKEIATCWYDSIKRTVKEKPELKPFVVNLFKDGKITNGEWDKLREEEHRIEEETKKNDFKKFLDSR